MTSTQGKTLIYEGCNFFRQRLLLATLSGRPVRINNIRSHEDDPGIKEFEASFIRVLDKISNGSKIEVNETGTSVYYAPGILNGGQITHDCSIQRGIGYFLEPIIALAPFCKKPLNITLRGVTNNQIDPSVDALKAGAISLLKRFLVNDEGLELRINKRGMPPKGGGEIVFSCPVCKQLKPVQYINPGKIKKIRGAAYAVRVSPSMANRLVESSKGVLLKFLSDVFILTDHRKGPASGLSPGFGLILTAETINGTFYSVDTASNPLGETASVAEDVGIEAAHALLEEVYRGGCVDSTNQSLAVLFMALGQKNVSKMQTGPLSTYTIEFLRHLRDFFGIMFKIETQQTEDEELRTGADKVLLTCVGVGYTNLSKITT
uniref:EOG090X05X4 n=1 Tax=Lynceus sp. MCZ IZ 141354 TaxID=1930659 RepID=A0A9N6ZEK0_9CRUS|nr:EOG090X05X4 [Lynceus sp. MCZ IZ 141354]